MHPLEAVIGYTFKDPALLETALTHSSAANESRGKRRSNERLEFLGDSVLSIVTSSYIFEAYKDIPEGDLTRLRAAVVCEQALYKAALELDLSRWLRLGKGEAAGGGASRPSILSDAMEAIIGAIYIDGGMEPAGRFVMSFTRANVEKTVRRGTGDDYKTRLQEIVQKNKEETLRYEVSGEEGPDHDKKFTVQLYLNSNRFATGTGHSKKAAEQDAAHAALHLMGEL